MRVLLLLAFSALTQGATVHRRQESSLTSEMSSSMMDTSSSMTQTTSTMLENTSSVSKTGSAMPTATAPPTPPSPASLDVTVLKFALTLERLEATFYALGLQHFNEAAMVAAGLSALQAAVVVSQMRAFLADESTHVAVIEDVLVSLGEEPNVPCGFDFSSVLVDPATFLATARVLEQVGVGAYLGAAKLISNDVALTLAGSISTIEARHQSLLNTLNGGTFAAQAFDLALDPEQVLALAGPFLTGCVPADLGLESNAPLTVTNKVTGVGSAFLVGSQLAFSSPVDLAQAGLVCQMFIGGVPLAAVQDASNCVIPPHVNGPLLVFITSSATPLQANLIDQNKATIVAGPALIFVDSQVDPLSSIFRHQAPTRMRKVKRVHA